ncbi:hypothetical protein B0H17DRAFT_1128574 [Mycena rosella]|uniref:Amidohydrolase-related domain-containing protein n=1 Tax=Mycena rosella TaxID=1033263 RepID=A0AAD7DWL9_MYCRO|nr:hypothetical protein B0H17DRAFT_1128574 [Mycena rosella]
MAASFMLDWIQLQLVDLGANQPYGDECICLGFVFNGFFLPKDMVVGLYEQVHSLDIKLITSHYCRNTIMGTNSHIAPLSWYGLLKDDILFSHANGALPEDAVQLTAVNVHISSTLDMELQIVISLSVCFCPDMCKVASLGVDCHTHNSGDILSQMCLVLQNVCGVYNQLFVEADKALQVVSNTVEDVYNLGTIMGTHTVGMSAEIRSIAVGKLADLILFDGQSPSMVCEAAYNSVAVIVLHTSVRDINMVIVNRQIRKAGRKLKAVELAEEGKLME